MSENQENVHPKATQSNDQRAAINVYISKELRQAFKVAVINEDLSMQEVIAAYIEAYVKTSRDVTARCKDGGSNK
jgi:hypothetical protein